MVDRQELRKLFQAKLAASSAKSTALSPAPRESNSSRRVADLPQQQQRAATAIAKTPQSHADDARHAAPPPRASAPSSAPRSASTIGHSTIGPSPAADEVVDASPSSPRPASPVPHHLLASPPSNLPSDFFSSSAPLPVPPTSVTASSPQPSMPSTSSTTSAPSRAGSGQRVGHLVRHVDGSTAEGDEAEGKADDLEAALRLAMAMSQALPVEPPPRPSAPMATTLAPSSVQPVAATSLTSELSAFEAELAVAEAGVRGAEEEETQRLSEWRRRAEDEEGLELHERLRALEEQVQQMKKRRMASRGGEAEAAAGNHKRRTRQPSSAPAAPQPAERSSDPSELFDELDAAFGWKRAQPP